MRRRLSHTKALWVTGLGSIALLAAMGVMAEANGLQIIDEMMRPQTVINTLALHDTAQLKSLFNLTLFLDFPFPFVYAAFFIGVIHKAYPEKSGRLMWLPLICLPADLIENFSQLMLYRAQMEIGTGTLETVRPVWLYVKAVATPIKLITFIAALLISIAGLIRLWRARKA